MCCACQRLPPPLFFACTTPRPVESLMEQLRSSKQGTPLSFARKSRIWDELKVQGFTRTLSGLYATAVRCRAPFLASLYFLCVCNSPQRTLRKTLYTDPFPRFHRHPCR